MRKAGFPAEAAQARGNFKLGRKRAIRGNPLTDGLNRVKRGLRRKITEGALLLPFLLTPASLSFNPATTEITPFITPAVLRAENNEKVYRVENITNKYDGTKGIRIYLGKNSWINVYSMGEELVIKKGINVYGWTIPLIKNIRISVADYLKNAPMPVLARELMGVEGIWFVEWYLGFSIELFLMFNPQTYKQLLSQGKRVGNVIINTGASAYNLGYGLIGQTKISGIHPKSPPEINLTEESLNQLMEKIKSGEENITFGGIPIKRVKENLEEAFKEDFETARKIENALRTGQGWEERGQSGNYTFTKRVKVLIPPELRQRIIEDLRRITQRVEEYIASGEWAKDNEMRRALVDYLMNNPYGKFVSEERSMFDQFTPWDLWVTRRNGGMVRLYGLKEIADRLKDPRRIGKFPISYTVPVNSKYNVIIYIGRGHYDEDRTPLIRFAMGMVDKETGFAHLIDETFVRIDRIEEFTQTLERYLGAAVLEVDVQGDGTFQSLLVRLPAFGEDGRLDIIQYQIPIGPPPEKHPFMPVATMIVEEELVGRGDVEVWSSFGFEDGGVYVGNIVWRENMFLLANGLMADWVGKIVERNLEKIDLAYVSLR